MKKILFNKFWLILFCVVSLTACLKDKDYDDGRYGSVRETGGKYVSLIVGGLNNFTKSSILISTLSPDVKTVEVTVSLDFAQKTTSPMTVKIGLDNAKIATYNAANNKNFQAVTSDMVKIKSTDLVIPAGENYAKTTIEIYQSKFDASKSYLIPISIIEAPGATLSSNINTRYFNIIGNPFAGSYKQDYTRWNNNTGTGANSGSTTAVSVTALPVTETTFSIASGYYIGPRYQVTYNQTTQKFSVVFNADDLKTMKDNGVEIVGAIKIEKADPVTMEFIFQYDVLSGGAASRYVRDRYYK